MSGIKEDKIKVEAFLVREVFDLICEQLNLNTWKMVAKKYLNKLKKQTTEQCEIQWALF